MSWLEAARFAVERHTFVMIRSDGSWSPPTETDWRAFDAHAEWAEQTESSVLASTDPEPPDGMVLDLFTASMLTQVHDALGTDNQARFVALDVDQAAAVGWKLTRRAA